MSILHSSKAYVYNLQTTSSAEAKRLWRKDVKEKWHYKCAYCGDGNNLTIDHVVPRSVFETRLLFRREVSKNQRMDGTRPTKRLIQISSEKE